MFLVEFSPMIPEYGMFFWTVLVFFLVWIFLGKTAFGPIADALQKRENDIQEAIDEAKLTKAKMAELKASNEKLLQEAREERVALLAEAKSTKEAIIAEAKAQAELNTLKMIQDAKMQIEGEKQTAMLEIKKEVGVIALDIAEKVLKRELKSEAEQTSFVEKMLSEINQN